jgi:hypothetical protein
MCIMNRPNWSDEFSSLRSIWKTHVHNRDKIIAYKHIIIIIIIIYNYSIHTMLIYLQNSILGNRACGVIQLFDYN